MQTNKIIKFLDSTDILKPLIALNIQNLNQLKILSDITLELNAPIIAQFSTRYFKFLDDIIGFDSILKKYRNTNIFFYLDHCSDMVLLKKCVDAGFDGVMYDGSMFELQKNIDETKEIMNYAHSKDCIVEGEIGTIGGEEDGKLGENKNFILVDAIKYYKETNVDLLALGIGNSHGIYNHIENVNVDLLNEFQNEIKKRVKLVLHGTSGLPISLVKKTIEFGVVKVNFSTDLKIATHTALKKYCNNSSQYDESQLFNVLKENLTIFYKNLINISTIK